MLSPSDGPLLSVFATVVRCRSFTAAATELKLSKSAVSERVRQLEERVGVALLERTTRRLRVTEAGERVFEASRDLDALLQRVSQGLDEAERAPSGLLRVSTTSDLGPILVGPAAARLVEAWPRVRVEVLADDAARDPIEARVDVAVRLGAPRASSFTLRRLAVLEEPIVAAPSLAERLGGVTRPRDLAGAPWVRHTLLSVQSMRFTGPHGAHDELVPDVRAEANSGPTLLSLLEHGAGVGVLPEHALREALYRGSLVRLCPEWCWKSISLYALLPPKGHVRPLHRHFLAELKAQLARDQVRWRVPAGEP